MREVAYTIGRAAVYDPLFEDDEPHWKLGQIDRKTGKRRLVSDDDSQIVESGGKPYLGGWLWRRAEHAHAYRMAARWRTEEWGDPNDFAVYEVELPHGWSTDVTASVDPELACYRLINDARLIRKIEP